MVLEWREEMQKIGRSMEHQRSKCPSFLTSQVIRTNSAMTPADKRAHGAALQSSLDLGRMEQLWAQAPLSASQ